MHLSRTAGNLGGELGLRPYLVTQGHVQKVNPGPVRAGGDIVQVPGEGFVNAKRSLALWDEFKAPASLIRRGDWIDRPSQGIPFPIFNTGLVTSEAASRYGQEAKANEILRSRAMWRWRRSLATCCRRCR